MESEKERVVVYAGSLDIQTISPALQDCEIYKAGSSGEVARAIVERKRVLALIVEMESVDESFSRLLSAIKRSFPVLQICQISGLSSPAEGESGLPVDYRIDASSRNLLGEMKSFIDNIDVSERRLRPRFDWPLKGELSVDGKTWSSHNIWALNADGAFLESEIVNPQRDTQAALSVSFQNSRMVTDCKVLDRRPPTDRLPGGFAVRFFNLSETSMQVIDRIIQDALVQILLDPDSEPEVPTLGESELAIPGFESF